MKMKMKNSMLEKIKNEKLKQTKIKQNKKMNENENEPKTSCTQYKIELDTYDIINISICVLLCIILVYASITYKYLYTQPLSKRYFLNEGYHQLLNHDSNQKLRRFQIAVL
jgi:hypothetical protein